MYQGSCGRGWGRGVGGGLIGEREGTSTERRIEISWVAGASLSVRGSNLRRFVIEALEPR